MAIKAPATMPTIEREFMKWLREAYDLGVMFGEGSPEGNVIAPVGTLYRRLDGGAGTTLYVKESGANATGWAAK